MLLHVSCQLVVFVVFSCSFFCCCCSERQKIVSLLEFTDRFGLNAIENLTVFFPSFQMIGMILELTPQMNYILVTYIHV